MRCRGRSEDGSLDKVIGFITEVDNHDFVAASEITILLTRDYVIALVFGANSAG